MAGEEGEEVAGVTTVDITEEENPRWKNSQRKSVRLIGNNNKLLGGCLMTTEGKVNLNDFVWDIMRDYNNFIFACMIVQPP